MLLLYHSNNTTTHHCCAIPPGSKISSADQNGSVVGVQSQHVLYFLWAFVTCVGVSSALYNLHPHNQGTTQARISGQARTGAKTILLLLNVSYEYNERQTTEQHIKASSIRYTIPTWYIACACKVFSRLGFIVLCVRVYTDVAINKQYSSEPA